MVSLMIAQLRSVAHSLQRAASRRTSAVLSRSTMLAAKSTIDSIAKISADMRASFSATAACLPIGRPHCSRSIPHFRAMAKHRFDTPTHAAGNVNRPVFSVVSATRSPLPSLSRIFSRGTRTLVKCTTPLYSAFNPMNRQRQTISTPGVFMSTTNAVIWFLGLPCTIFGGVFAITTITPAFTPLVHQLFAVNDKRSAIGCWLRMRFHFCGIGSNLCLGQRECRNFAASDSRQKPAFLIIGSEQDQRLWHANRLVRGNQRSQIAAETSEHHTRATVVGLREPETTELRRNLDPERTHSREAVDHFLRDLSAAVDLIRIRMFFQECPEPLQKYVTGRDVCRILHRERIDALEIKMPHEQSAGEPAFGLRRLACGLRELECFALRRRHFRSVDDGLRISDRHKWGDSGLSVMLAPLATVERPCCAKAEGVRREGSDPSCARRRAGARPYRKNIWLAQRISC